MKITREEWNVALIKKHGAERQRCFSFATAAICGLGGLGSNIALILARAGVGKLILIDFDRVDISNLQRQQYKFSQIGKYKTEALKECLAEINPFTELEAHTERITKENAVRLLQGADVVCEAFDNPTDKAMLAETVLSETDKYLVAASGMAGMGSANDIITRKIADRFYLCGDGTSDTSVMTASRVALCAAHQAHMTLKILCRETDD